MGSEVTAAPIGRAAYRKDDLLGYWAMNGGWRGATSSAALATVVLAAALAPNSTKSAVANGDTRTVTFSNQHTNEEASFTYMVNGVYDQAVLDKLNWFMRDWRLNEPTKMDPKLFDIIWEVYRESGSREPIDVLSGYRSPQTNAMLRRRSRQVAEHSEHMQGKAIDAHFLDVSTARIRDIAMRMQEGGVGFYPTGITPWVHIDSGGIRYWPRMSRDALTRLFPDGKTVFIPADGQPMPGYDLAKAEIEQRGGEVQTASGGGLFAWLFGARGGGDDDAEEAGGQEAVVASNAGGRGGAHRGGGVAPEAAPVEIAEAGPAAVAKAKRGLPTGPAYAEPAAAEPAAAEPRAAPPRAGACRQGGGRRGARTAASGERRRDRRDGQAYRADRGALSRAPAAAAAAQPRAATGAAGRHSPAPDPARRSDRGLANSARSAAAGPPRPPRLGAGADRIAGDHRVDRRAGRRSARTPRRRDAKPRRARGADRRRQTLAERHHPGPDHAPDRRGARPRRSPEIPGCGQRARCSPARPS